MACEFFYKLLQVFTDMHIWAMSGQEVDEATFGQFWSVNTLWKCHKIFTPPATGFLKKKKTTNGWVSQSFEKRKKQMVSAVLRFLPFHARAHKSSACNAWTAAALRLIWRMLPPSITLAAIVLFIPQCQCLTSDGNVCFNYLSFFFFVGCRLHIWFELLLHFSHCLYVLKLIMEWFLSTHA